VAAGHCLRNETDGLKLSDLRVEKLDLLDPHDVASAANWELDVVVNNAGVGEGGPSVKFPWIWFAIISR